MHVRLKSKVASLASFQILVELVVAIAFRFTVQLQSDTTRELPPHPLGLKPDVRTCIYKCNTATVGQRSQHPDVFSLGRSAAS